LLTSHDIESLVIEFVLNRINAIIISDDLFGAVVARPIAPATSVDISTRVWLIESKSSWKASRMGVRILGRRTMAYICP
jgi:hypothetical protein